MGKGKVKGEYLPQLFEIKGFAFFQCDYFAAYLSLNLLYLKKSKSILK